MVFIDRLHNHTRAASPLTLSAGSVGGRQIATERDGREFSFDTLASGLIAGADIDKTSNAANQDSGIGSYINLKTVKPFDMDGQT